MNYRSPIAGDIWHNLEAAAVDAARGADPGHDILHVRRVVQNASIISATEAADEKVVLSAALLHELFNYPKDHPDSAQSGAVCAERAAEILHANGVPAVDVESIAYAIRVHSFSSGIVPETLEARILQDADRLDAIGAIGIARTFSTGSAMRRPFYSEEDPFCHNREPNDKAYTLDHFYRKLLKLPTSFHTDAARKVAVDRVEFMLRFVDQLDREIPTI